MKAMILAAGRGERMRPLTDHTPKPLLEVNGKALIVYHLEKFRHAGIKDVVINLAHLGEKIRLTLGDGSAFGVKITYSQEPEKGLETGGGIYQALPLLGKEPFIVVNADIFTDYSFINIPKQINTLAHLVLVDNPEHYPQGDFSLQNHTVTEDDSDKLTFSGIGIYHPDLFKHCTPGFFPLAPLLRTAMQTNQVTGEHYQGKWTDVGTPDRLSDIQNTT